MCDPYLLFPEQYDDGDEPLEWDYYGFIYYCILIFLTTLFYMLPDRLQWFASSCIFVFSSYIFVCIIQNMFDK